MQIMDQLKRFQGLLGPFWWHSGLMFGVARIGDLANIVIGLFLVPMYVAQQDLGAVLPLLQIGAFFAVPLAAAAKTTARYVTVFRVNGETGRIRAILRDLMVLSAVISVLGAVTMLGGRSFLAARLKFEGVGVPLLVSGMIILSCWRPIVNLANQGLGNYYRITASSGVAALARILLALALLPLFRLEGYLAMQLFSGLAATLFLLYGLRSYFTAGVISVSNRALLREAGKYFVPILMYSMIVTFQGVMEPWIIRHRLPFEESAAYYVTTRFGMIPGYLAAAMVPFLFPMVAERHDRGESTRNLQWQIMFGLAVVGGLVTIILAWLGPWLLGLFPAWRPYTPYASLLWKTGLIAVGTSMIRLYCLQETACRRFGFLWILTPVTLLEIGGLYSLMGWSFFRNILPPAIWETVNAWPLRNIDFLVHTMMATRVVIFVGLVLIGLRHRKD